jgi:hypothetical protein
MTTDGRREATEMMLVPELSNITRLPSKRRRPSRKHK